MKPRVVTMALSRQGGLNQCTHALNVALTDLGWEVLHITSKNYELSHAPRAYRVEEVFNLLRTDPRDVVRMVRHARLWRPLAIHLNGAEHPARYLALFSLFRLTQDTPLVYGAHNVTPQWTGERVRLSPAQRWILRTLGDIATCVIVSARENKERLVRLTGLPPWKVEVVPIGNSLPLRDPARGAEAWDPDPTEPPPTAGTNVLFFGNIVPSKGLEYLLRAFALVRRERPTARLRVVGRPVEPFHRYGAIIRELDLSSHVETVLTFVPFEEVLQHFRWADLLVLPYVRTSQSAVIFTASAVARPTVVTSVGGLPEAVEHGRSGLIVAPGDPEALAEAVGAILRDTDRRIAMGKRAQELCSTVFSWRTIARRTAQIYASLAHRPTTPA